MLPQSGNLAISPTWERWPGTGLARPRVPHRVGDDAAVGSPQHPSAMPGVEVDGFSQACSEPAPNRGPALPLAVVGDQTSGHRRDVERVLDVALLERARGDPATRCPGTLVQRQAA